jgi:hypothetical protein
MAADPKIRASDEDRDRTVSLLREHHAAGRLTPEEFNDRIDQALEAKTLGELDELMSDLPAIDLYRLPHAALQRRPGTPGSDSLSGALIRSQGDLAASGRFSPAWLAAWGSWLSVSLLCLVIWVIAGASGFPWPVWVAGPLGAILIGRWISGSPPGGHGHGHHGPGRGHGPA